LPLPCSCKLPAIPHGERSMADGSSSAPSADSAPVVGGAGTISADPAAQHAAQVLRAAAALRPDLHAFQPEIEESRRIPEALVSSAQACGTW
jgi:hypothetical protein